MRWLLFLAFSLFSALVLSHVLHTEEAQPAPSSLGDSRRNGDIEAAEELWLPDHVWRL